MSENQREALIKQILNTQPSLGDFLKEPSLDMVAGSWDIVSYSFQQGFEVLWDLAHQNGLLLRPLLSIWRQSIELALKAAIFNIEKSDNRTLNHDLNKLLEKLITTIKFTTNEGLHLNDDLTKQVHKMIDEIQSYDSFADRFRYPMKRNGKPHGGIDVDLDKLFMVHWIIVTWCEGITVKLGEEFGIGQPT